MKSFRFTFSILFFLSFSQLGLAKIRPQPTCEAIGTPFEGWTLSSRQIKYDRCSGKIVECANVASPLEGWIIYEKVNFQVLQYTNCSAKIEASAPRCGGIGTQSEGWMLGERQISYESCSNKGVMCMGAGTESEAWVSYDKVNPEVLEYADCADSVLKLAKTNF